MQFEPIGIILTVSTENVTGNVFQGETIDVIIIIGGCTMKRKLVSLMLVAAMAATMVAGCGKDSKEKEIGRAHV